MTVDELKKMFFDANKDSVKTWKDIRSSWPATPIKMFIPGTDSGTFDYFKEVVAGKTGSIRSDVSVSEDDNVLVRGIAGNEGAIGFFGCAYYFANKDKIRSVAIDGGKGAILPSAGETRSFCSSPSRFLHCQTHARRCCGSRSRDAFHWLQNCIVSFHRPFQVISDSRCCFLKKCALLLRGALHAAKLWV